mgnify:FL=1
MARRKNRKTRNSRKVKQSWRGRAGEFSFLFKDTTLTKKVANDPDDEINYTVNNGCFSLSGRTVTPRGIIFQVIPTLSNTAITADLARNIAIQAQALLNGEPFALEPFRYVSNVNPSWFILDFDELEEHVPAIKTVYGSDDSTVYARLAFSGSQLEAPREFEIRATHFWDVFPQTKVVAGPV